VAEWEEWLGGLTLPVDTSNQLVCPVGQADCHSCPDHIMSQDVQWTPSHPINAPQWPHRICFGLSWLESGSKKLFVKADMLIYSSTVCTVLECGYYIKQLNGFQFLCIHGGFSQIQSHITIHSNTIHNIMLIHIW